PIGTAPLSVVHFGVLYLPRTSLSTENGIFGKPARGRGGGTGKLWGICHLFTALPRRLAMVTTMEDRANRAMALGLTMRLLNRSVRHHTRSLDMVVRRKMNTRASTPCTGAAFLPNRYITLILPNRFQPSTVEKAKKNRQMATKMAPKWAPSTVPKAVWARLALLRVAVMSPT